MKVDSGWVEERVRRPRLPPRAPSRGTDLRVSLDVRPAAPPSRSSRRAGAIGNVDLGRPPGARAPIGTNSGIEPGAAVLPRSPTQPQFAPPTRRSTVRSQRTHQSERPPTRVTNSLDR